MKTYKVWVEIEEYNDRTDEYTNVDFNAGTIREFRRYEDAARVANALHDIGDLAARYFTDIAAGHFLEGLYQIEQCAAVTYKRRPPQKGGGD